MGRDDLVKLIEEGLSQREIASRIGKSQASVKHWLGKHGLKTLHKQHNVKTDYRCACGEANPDNFAQRAKDRRCHRVCKQCHYRIRIERYREKKRRAVEYKGGACQDCGYDKCPGALQFHHRSPEEKDPRWKHMRSWSFEKTKAELDKCDLLCATCHAEKHWYMGR